MEGESDVEVVSFLQTCSEALREASLMAYCGKAINLATEIQFYYRSSYHIARKFGGELNLAVWRSILQPPN